MTMPVPMFRGRCRTALFATILFLGLHASAAQAAGGDSDAWQFELTPYLFATGLQGTTGVAGVTAKVDASFGDLFENIESAFMGTFTARKGPWVMGFDVIYAKLGGQNSNAWQGPGGIGSANGTLDLTLTQQVYQLALGYRVLDGQTKIDVFGAGRYTRIDTDIDLSRTGTLVSGAALVRAKESWWDPVIGVRVVAPIAADWSFIGYADYGGFGVGSDSTYQAFVGVNWHIDKSYSVKAGYRYLYQDYEDDDNQFVWDMAMQGVYLGLGITF